MNQYIIGYGYFIDDNVKFASVDFYVEEYVSGTDTYYSIVPRFILSDESKVSLEEYVDSGFEELLEKIEEIAANFER